MGGTGLKREAYLFNRNEGGNLLTIAGGHALDALAYIMGDPKELSAITASRYPKAKLTDTNVIIKKTTEDQIIISGKLVSGLVVNVHLQGGIQHLEGSRLEIYGGIGTLVLTSSSRIQRGPYKLMGLINPILNSRN